jgi:thiosulfate/3-mercaptopyruvate sulfurtransferase
MVDAEGAAGIAASGALIDARVAGRFRGEFEPVDKVAGHIPGAVNIPYGDLVEPDGRLRPATELQKLFAAAKSPVACYCGSGVTAAHTILALNEAGIEDAALYVGSWSHWITDPNRPIATGDES